jgi:hypothetical protein
MLRRQAKNESVQCILSPRGTWWNGQLHEPAYFVIGGKNKATAHEANWTMEPAYKQWDDPVTRCNTTRQQAYIFNIHIYLID